MDRAKRETLEAEIERRAPSFDPVALLEVLEHLGYRLDEIRFESHETNTSQPGIISKVTFSKAPRQVVVSLNMGLLGPQSPLPTYFTDILEDADIDENAFREFLRFFDHRLLEAWLLAVAPERDKAIFRNFDDTKKSLFKLLGTRSVATMHWIFEITFPELEVYVERSKLTRPMRLDGCELGKAILGGDAVLGGLARVPVPGFNVLLYCDEEHNDMGRPWAEEARKRLDGIIFPAIADAALDMKVSLVIRSEKVWARLRPGSYLGFDRMKGGSRRNREVLIWKGQVTPDVLLRGVTS